jgi:hypothetical protein
MPSVWNYSRIELESLLVSGSKTLRGMSAIRGLPCHVLGCRICMHDYLLAWLNEGQAKKGTDSKKAGKSQRERCIQNTVDKNGRALFVTYRR